MDVTGRPLVQCASLHKDPATTHIVPRETPGPICKQLFRKFDQVDFFDRFLVRTLNYLCKRLVTLLVRLVFLSLFVLVIVVVLRL
jgi:hypothetical protein